MANRIKYNAGIDANSLNIGNWSVGLQGTGMGPTASTGFKNGVQIPAGGYAIYTEGVRARIAVDDTELVFILNKLGANVQDGDTAGAIKWARANYVLVVNHYFENIVTNGLVLNLDAKQSYAFTDNKPTVNQVSNWDLDTGWAKGYQWDVAFNEIEPPIGVDAPTVGFNKSNAGSSYWYSYGNYTPQTPGSTYTVSMYVKTNDPSFSINFYTADNSETGRFWSSHIGVPNDGKWHRVVWPAFTNPSNSQSDSLSFNMNMSGEANNASQNRTWFCAPQMELGTVATPFVKGTRAQTNEFYNLLNNTTQQEFTLVGITYPEGSYYPANRQGITPGRDNISGGKLYDASRDINYYAFDEDTCTWVSDAYFNGERVAGHCYDTYDGQPNQHEQFNSDFNNINATFPNATHIIIASHAADNFWTNAAMLDKLISIGLPDGIAGNGRPEFILVGKVNKPWTWQFEIENISWAAALMNISLPLEGRKLNVVNNPTYDANVGQFNMNETQGFQTSQMPTNSTTSTVAIWYKTTDPQELWVRGQTGSYYIAAAYYGGNYYHEGSGSPSYYIDTVSSIKPEAARNGRYHMFEAKNVNFSTWTQMNWFLYGSSWNMNGSVGKIMVYDRSITAEESKQNYYGGSIVTDNLIYAIDAGNLVSYENGSTSVYSLTGSGTSTLVNGVSFNKANNGYWGFDGSDDYIQTNLTGTYSQITYEFVGFFDDQSLNTHLRNESAFGDWNASRIHFGTRWIGAGMHWNVNGIWNEIPTTNLKYGWNHYVLVWDHINNKKLVYLNGILSDSKTTNGNITMGDFKIGVASTLNQFYRGNISTFKTYSKALTQEEVLQNYNAQAARFK